MKPLLILVALAGLAACANAASIPASTPMPEGAAAAPPAGWSDYCRRNPGDVSC